MSESAKKLSFYSYIDLVCIGLCFHLLDILSTDFLVFVAPIGAFETNQIEAQLHGSPGIFLFRGIFLGLFVAGFYFCRLQDSSVNELLKFSSLGLLTKPEARLSLSETTKFTILIMLFGISIGRLLAAISNMSVYFFEFGFLNLMQLVLPDVTGTAATLLLSAVFALVSILIMAIIWDWHYER